MKFRSILVGLVSLLGLAFLPGFLFAVLLSGGNSNSTHAVEKAGDRPAAHGPLHSAPFSPSRCALPLATSARAA